MQSFKYFLAEKMKTDEIVATLQDMGYTIKKVSGNSISIVADGDRVEALKTIAKKLKGNYDPKGSGSSIGRTELKSGIKIFARPSGGGSGAGSETTKLAESAQCVYRAAAWYGKDFSGKTFKSVMKHFDIDAKLNDVINKLPEQWIDSCVISAQVLKSKFGTKNYTFHRGSKWVDTLENHWKALNRTEKQFANLNKWSPADIYMVSDSGSNIDLTKAKTMIELNAMMMKAIKSKDIIGVSLKQAKGSANLDFKNISADRYTYEFESLTVGKRGFLLSGDGYIKFNGGEIQFRTFGSTWQGEIKGKNANMGKISGGPINDIMARLGSPIKAQNEIVDKTPALMKLFYEYYKHFEKSNALSYEKFEQEVNKKDQNWWVSKFLSAQLLYTVDKNKDKNKIVTSMIGYAASESEMSGPYVKVS